MLSERALCQGLRGGLWLAITKVLRIEVHQLIRNSSCTNIVDSSIVGLYMSSHYELAPCLQTYERHPEAGSLVRPGPDSQGTRTLRLLMKVGLSHEFMAVCPTV